MLTNLRYLLLRLSGRGGWVDEVRQLRRELASQPGPEAVGEAERRSALELCRLREVLASRFVEVQACRGCVRPRHATWLGGQCCSGDTWKLFTQSELSALRLSGTKPSDLVPVGGERSGCVFRGPKGCSLAAAHRPSICVRYTCRELESELEQREDCDSIVRLQEELRSEFARFEQQRTARLEAERLLEMQASLGERE